ncbi:hypothetical protein JW868_02620, partial [Candidatus Woesearchaeota archaeon]|nr:hypothetical protein [Candidatus Woesearchaeota archaeon]
AMIKKEYEFLDFLQKISRRDNKDERLKILTELLKKMNDYIHLNEYDSSDDGNLLELYCGDIWKDLEVEKNVTQLMIRFTENRIVGFTSFHRKLQEINESDKHELSNLANELVMFDKYTREHFFKLYYGLTPGRQKINSR